MRAEQDTTGAGGSVRAGDPNVSAAGTRDGAPRLSGHIKSISRLAILGWAGDLDRPDHPVEILVTVNNRRPIRVTANPAVSSSATPGPHGAREHRFMLPFTPPLSTARDQRITVAFAETGLMLKGGEARIRAFTPDEIEARLSQTRPLKPIFVVCTARSGSTLLMRRLASHPNILAAKHAVHEVRMTHYYAGVLRVLTSPGDHERSMRPPQLAEQRHVVGSNPFYHPLFERAFATKDARDFFFQSVMFDRLKSALRDVVVDYYRSIAADTGKHGATFFVEKLMDAGAQREMVLSMFPEAKEILLVRDLRDVLCSRKNFTKQLPEDPITPMRQSAKHLIGMARNGGSNAIVVRYEDLVLREQQTLERLFGAIGVDCTPVANPNDEGRLLSKHATSKSPATSIGRWRRELTDAEQQQANEAFKEYLETFEYA